MCSRPCIRRRSSAPPTTRAESARCGCSSKTCVPSRRSFAAWAELFLATHDERSQKREEAHETDKAPRGREAKGLDQIAHRRCADHHAHGSAGRDKTLRRKIGRAHV